MLLVNRLITKRSVSLLFDHLQFFIIVIESPIFVPLLEMFRIRIDKYRKHLLSTS